LHDALPIFAKMRLVITPLPAMVPMEKKTTPRTTAIVLITRTKCSSSRRIGASTSTVSFVRRTIPPISVPMPVEWTSAFTRTRENKSSRKHHVPALQDIFVCAVQASRTWVALSSQTAQVHVQSVDLEQARVGSYPLSLRQDEHIPLDEFSGWNDQGSPIAQHGCLGCKHS